jgi:hypothetical protein
MVERVSRLCIHICNNPLLRWKQKAGCLQVVMVEPVIAADGHTYERAALEEWLLQHVTSPVTGDFLPHTRIVPNVLIKSAIQTNRAR